MEEFIGYILKSGISLLSLYIFYWLLLRKDTHFKLNRSVLLFSLVCSILVPFINIYVFAILHFKEEVPVFYATFNEVVIRVTTPKAAYIEKSIDWWHFITTIYFMGVAIVLGRLIYQGIYLHVMAKLSNTIRKGKFTIVLMNAEITPFAYFNKVFIPASKADDFSIDTIVAHERAHQQQYHFIDLFVMQLVKVVQWFNPVVWFYERSLKEVHEYLADETVLQSGQNKGVYQALLVNEAMGGPVFSLTNQFNQSLIKKRILMMTKMRSSRLTQLKVLLVFPLMMLILLAFANPNGVVKPMVNKGKELLRIQNQSNLAVSEVSKTDGIQKTAEDDTPLKLADKMPEFPGGMDSLMSFLGKNIKYPSIASEMGITGKVLVQFIVNKQGQVNGVKVLKGIGGGCDEEAIRVVNALPLWKPGMDKGKVVSVYFTIPVMFSLKGDKDKKSINEIPGENTPLTFVEQMPEFPGGVVAMKNFLAQNIKYPSIAAEMGISGKVVVQLIVDKQGKLTNLKIIRALGGGCDEEAIRVIKTMPDWKPGYHKGNPVSVYFTLPINFALKGDHPKENEVSSVPEDAPLTFVEQMPEFPGGVDAMMKYLGSNIKYPSVAQKMGLSGKVVVQFIVDKQGKISNVKIIRALGGGCDEEAVRVVNSMPAWKPGKQKGKTVPVYFTLPVFFQLK